MKAALVLLLGALLAPGCATAERELAARVLHPPTSLVCKDGRPVRLLVAEACADGFCGWTCAPGRWVN